MSDLYNKILYLCESRGINITRMCKESAVSRASISDLKMGRKQSLSADTLTKIADYFGVSVDYLLGKEETKKAPEKREPNKEDIKIALFGGDGEVTDEMWEEALFAAQLIKERYKRKKKEE